MPRSLFYQKTSCPKRRYNEGTAIKNERHERSRQRRPAPTSPIPARARIFEVYMSANLALIPFAELQAISGKTRCSAVERWLTRENIPFRRDGLRRPFTTVDALNHAIYGPTQANRQEINTDAFL
jgi:hypothetical protein